MRSAVYLFCVARSGRLPDMEGESYQGHTLRQHRFRNLVAIWSQVPLEEFSGPQAGSRMGDLSWVGPRACRHEAVVEEVMRFSPVLPAHFATVFSSLASLEGALHRHHDEILQFLDHIADQEEWAVKGLLHRSRVREEFLSRKLAQEAPRLATLSPGRRYFHEQRLRVELEKDLNRWLGRVCQEMVQDLRGYAVDLCERRLLSREAPSRQGDLILNWAFLVPRSAVPEFKRRLEAANAHHGRRGLVFECTGPWPPYSFSPSLTQEPGA
jgi:hypothetical protein